MKFRKCKKQGSLAQPSAVGSALMRCDVILDNILASQ